MKVSNAQAIAFNASHLARVATEMAAYQMLREEDRAGWYLMQLETYKTTCERMGKLIEDELSE